MAKTPAEFDHMTHDVPPTSDMGGALTPAALASAKKKKHRSRPLFDDRASSLAATAQVQADLLATASDCTAASRPIPMACATTRPTGSRSLRIFAHSYETRCHSGNLGKMRPQTRCPLATHRRRP